MTLPGAGDGPAARPDLLRRLGTVAAAILALAVVLPPMFQLSRRYEFAQALQFSVYAIAVPALLAIGLPWARLRPGWRTDSVQSREPALAERLELARRPHRVISRSTLLLGLFMGSVVLWRTPGAVDAVERHPWLLVIEVASLAVIGLGFWSELVESGPLVARSRRPFRAVMAAVAMWTVWTVAYLLGFSSSSWYPAFHHLAGHGLSTAADQQLSTAVL